MEDILFLIPDEDGVSGAEPTLFQTEIGFKTLVMLNIFPWIENASQMIKHIFMNL